MLTTEQTPCPQLLDLHLFPLDQDDGHQRPDGPAGPEEPAEELRSEMRTLRPRTRGDVGRSGPWVVRRACRLRRTCVSLHPDVVLRAASPSQTHVSSAGPARIAPHQRERSPARHRGTFTPTSGRLTERLRGRLYVRANSQD